MKTLARLLQDVLRVIKTYKQNIVQGRCTLFKQLCYKRQRGLCKEDYKDVCLSILSVVSLTGAYVGFKKWPPFKQTEERRSYSSHNMACSSTLSLQDPRSDRPILHWVKKIQPDRCSLPSYTSVKSCKKDM